MNDDHLNGDPQLMELVSALVACAKCGQLAFDRGNHMSLHYPDARALQPCEASWPGKAKR